VDESESSTPFERAIPFVLRLGVTGHRDPADPSAVYGETQASIEALLLFMVDRLSSARRRSRPLKQVSTPLSVQVLSALAEGADRIAVGATIAAAGVVAVPEGTDSKRRWPREFGTIPPFSLDEYRRARKGWASELTAIIPYALDEYRSHDCTSDESLAEFDRLLSLDPRPTVLQRRSPTSGDQRDHWYRQAGQYVVDHCDVLLALWDGTDNRMAAGTAATVEYALRQETPVLWVPTPRSVAVRLECPLGCDRVEPQLILRRWRSDRTSQRGHSLEPNILRTVLTNYYRQATRRSDFIERAERLEEFNSLAQHLDAASDDDEGSGAGNWPDESNGSGCSRGDELMTKVARCFSPKREVADQLANRYQKKMRRLDLFVCVAAVTVGVLPVFFNPVVLESFIFIFLLGITALNIRRTPNVRWRSYRALTEYWRSNEFMSLVVPPSPDRAEAPTPLMERVLAHSRIVPWFAPVVENVWRARPQFSIAETDVQWMRQVLIEWIEDQRGWLERKRKEHNRQSVGYGLAIGGVFVISVALVLFYAGQTMWVFVRDHERHFHFVMSGSTASVVIALASAGIALSALASQANHAGHADRLSDEAYKLSEPMLEINAADSLGALRRSALAVFRIMLGETSTWFEGMESSEVVVPP
jgi:hypothetical protein